MARPEPGVPPEAAAVGGPSGVTGLTGVGPGTTPAAAAAPGGPRGGPGPMVPGVPGGVGPMGLAPIGGGGGGTGGPPCCGDWGTDPGGMPGLCNSNKKKVKIPSYIPQINQGFVPKS